MLNYLIITIVGESFDWINPGNCGIVDANQVPTIIILKTCFVTVSISNLGRFIVAIVRPDNAIPVCVSFFRDIVRSIILISSCIAVCIRIFYKKAVRIVLSNALLTVSIRNNTSVSIINKYGLDRSLDGILLFNNPTKFVIGIFKIPNTIAICTRFHSEILVICIGKNISVYIVNFSEQAVCVDKRRLS